MVKDKTELWNWLNGWADYDKYPELTAIKNKRTPFGKGYKQAVKDIFKKLKQKGMVSP